jgi:hypothetical protein
MGEPAGRNEGLKGSGVSENSQKMNGVNYTPEPLILKTIITFFCEGIAQKRDDNGPTGLCLLNIFQSQRPFGSKNELEKILV